MCEVRRIPHRDDRLDGGKWAAFAGGFKAGGVGILSINGVDVIRIDGEVVAS